MTNKTEGDFEGKDIREVWNYRLSKATPLIVRRGGYWHVEVWAKSNPDYAPGESHGHAPAQPLHSANMGIVHEPGDENDRDKIKKCYAYLYSIRDKYSLPHIDLIKPVVSYIEQSNDRASDLNAAMQVAKKCGDNDLASKYFGELGEHINSSNQVIRGMTKEMRKKIDARESAQ